MSVRPEMRLVLRHKTTKKYVDAGAVWPCKFEGESFPKGITIGNKGGNNPVSQEEVGNMIASGEYWLDMREVSKPKTNEWGDQNAE